MKTITAAEANRQFSSLLRGVSQGEVFTVVSRGRPVAMIGPVDVADAERHRAKEALLRRLETQAVTGSRDWTRGELYE